MQHELLNYYTFNSTLGNKYACYSHILSIFQTNPPLPPLLRLRPNATKKINQGQITIQERNQFGGRNRRSKLCSDPHLWCSEVEVI